MSKIRKISNQIFYLLRITTLVLGCSFLLFLLLGLTSLPFWARYSLAKYKAFIPENPKTIVVMGGGGFPSEALLMRLWYTKELAKQYPASKIIVTTPGNFSDSTSTIFQMHQYLIDQQISSDRILIENEGLNTRHQAMLVRDMFDCELFEEPLVLVSSPSHMYRSIKCFSKVGFMQVSGQPTTEVMLEADLRINGKELGGKKIISASENSISLRYKLWDYLKYEIEVVREYLAIVYYKMQGWI